MSKIAVTACETVTVTLLSQCDSGVGTSDRCCRRVSTRRHADADADASALAVTLLPLHQKLALPTPVHFLFTSRYHLFYYIYGFYTIVYVFTVARRSCGAHCGPTDVENTVSRLRLLVQITLTRQRTSGQ